VAHVLDGAPLVDGRPARVIRRDDRLDLALLAVPGVRGDAPVIARDDPRIVRRANASVDGSSWKRPVLELRIDAARGNSGAPVLTPSGELVGVIFARSRLRPGHAWAIDAAAADQALEELQAQRLD
jgi:S1-C subfamily serine protease